MRRLARHPVRASAGTLVLVSLTVAGLAPGSSTTTNTATARSQDLIVLASATPVIPAVERQRCAGRIALTFDDGPSAAATNDLIDVLVARNVPATFFVVGQRVADNGRVLRRMERAGFLIANHSWAHEQLTAHSRRQVLRSLRSTDRALRRVGVHPTGLMRPPYGAIDRRTRAAIREAGLRPVLWTIDSEDWISGGPAQIARRILGSLRRGDNIVLQHDGLNRSALSVRAVSAVVRTARRRGFCFVALDEAGRAGFPSPRISVVGHDGTAGRPARVELRLDRSAARPIPVVLVTRSGTASSGPALRQRVVIPAGRRSLTVPIPAAGTDGTAAAVRLVVTPGPGARLARPSTDLTITSATGHEHPARPARPTRLSAWSADGTGFRFWR